MTKMILMIREDEWGLIVLSRVMMVEDGGSSRGWRDAFFYFRDEIEILLPSVSCLETRSRFFSQNLRVRDEIEIFVHWISGFETRSRFSVIWSRNSRRDRDFSMKFFLPCDIQNCIFLYTTNTYSWIRKSQSNPRRDFLTPSWAIVEWGQSCNTSKSTFTFVQIVSRHCARMRTVSPEVGWKWK